MLLNEKSESSVSSQTLESYSVFTGVSLDAAYTSLLLESNIVIVIVALEWKSALFRYCTSRMEHYHSSVERWMDRISRW